MLEIESPTKKRKGGKNREERVLYALKRGEKTESNRGEKGGKTESPTEEKRGKKVEKK